MTATKGKSFRNAFMAEVKKPQYRVEKVKVGGEEIEFKVRDLTFREADEFEEKSNKGKKDSIDKFFMLIEMGVFADMDGSPLFEQEDKDTIKDSEVNGAISDLFISFAKTRKDGESIEKN